MLGRRRKGERSKDRGRTLTDREEKGERRPRNAASWRTHRPGRLCSVSPFSFLNRSSLCARSAHRPGGTRTHDLRINTPLRLSPPRRQRAPRVRGPDSVFTCASRGQVAPVESLHLPGFAHGFPAWLGVGISHRSPTLSAFTRAVSSAVLQFFSKSAALPVELPARGRLSAPEKVELLKVESRRERCSVPPSLGHPVPEWNRGGLVGRPCCRSSTFYFLSVYSL